MLFRSEDPPSPGNLSVETPPDSKKPTTAMLKADIDSGRTGDKISHYDPGLSQLGTDDEAAGNAPSHERVALARKTEAASPEVLETAQAGRGNKWVLPIFVWIIVFIPLVISVLLFLLK